MVVVENGTRRRKRGRGKAVRFYPNGRTLSGKGKVMDATGFATPREETSCRKRGCAEKGRPVIRR